MSNDNLSPASLSEQYAKCAKEMAELRKKALVQVQKLVTDFDIRPEDIRFKGVPAEKPAKVPPKYQGPEGQTWTGNGREPAWFAKCLKDGYTDDDLLVKPGAEGEAPASEAYRLAQSEKNE